MKKVYNLNEYSLTSDGNYPDQFKDNSIYDKKKDIRVFFRNITEHLIKEIEKADIIVGCIAWLTCSKIIDALSKKAGVSIIVQKEDFLRPDTGESKDKWKNWKETLRKRYGNLRGNLDKFMFDNILSKTSVCSNPLIDPIRCVGNYNKSKRPAFPRMHNKFLVFARIRKDKIKIAKDMVEERETVEPYAVWTGSFNLTKTAGKSLENALLIKDPDIVKAYYEEYGQICAMSEPLNWESDWVEPQWRIGT